MSPLAIAKEACKAAEPVCKVRSSVFRIESFEIYGSAVRIGRDLLVTNRHVVADEKSVKIYLPDGSQIEGKVVPTSYRGDLILIQADLPEGEAIRVNGKRVTGELRTVGYDIDSKTIKVFPPGKLLLARDSEKPFSRLQHTAFMQSGTSGGAVVDEKGVLVGIAASGGEGRFEAIPADQLDVLRKKSGDGHADASQEIGLAYRHCVVNIEELLRARGQIKNDSLDRTVQVCQKSENRQLIDIVAQVYGRQRNFSKSAELLLSSLDRDPQSINTRLSLVITLHFAQRYEEERPHLKELLEIIPEEASLHRMALQAGKSLNDQELIETGLALIKKHNPRGLEAAQRFLGAKGTGR